MFWLTVSVSHYFFKISYFKNVYISNDFYGLMYFLVKVKGNSLLYNHLHYYHIYGQYTLISLRVIFALNFHPRMIALLRQCWIAKKKMKQRSEVDVIIILTITFPFGADPTCVL